MGLACSYIASKRERERWALQSIQEKLQSYESLLEKIFTESSADPLKAKILEDLIHVRRPTIWRGLHLDPY
jgi:hypothetical protein